ncbi:Hypothetical protein CINCED_3A024148 [Cinara cedri]|uniref:Uncharacterized protein n=1 Tax=Cinara cedri TaxID=506608 RepID=A0A5E4N748_9HEMI|nr:Hypothetical protein CINCED_3A024148 [Cinara cedri]
MASTTKLHIQLQTMVQILFKSFKIFRRVNIGNNHSDTISNIEIEEKTDAKIDIENAIVKLNCGIGSETFKSPDLLLFKKQRIQTIAKCTVLWNK